MRAPPAVSVICAPDRAWRGSHALLGACAAATLGAWIGMGLQDTVTGLAAAAIAASFGAVVAWRWSAQALHRLAWTGAEWRLSTGADAEGERVQPPAVMLDLGPWMLMRVYRQPGAATVWLSLGRRAAGASWHLFRAAVYSFETDRSPLPSEQSPPF